MPDILMPQELTPEMAKAVSELPIMKKIEGVLVLHQIRNGYEWPDDPDGSMIEQIYRACVNVVKEQSK